jgi:hypothetical protein
MKLLIVQFYPASCYLDLMSKCIPQNPVLETPSLHVYCNLRHQICYQNKTAGRIILLYISILMFLGGTQDALDCFMNTFLCISVVPKDANIATFMEGMFVIFML